MIYLTSQKEADRLGLPPERVQSISPYQNPAHVLAPPRIWLEKLINGAYNWSFFRWRYKSLLRERFRQHPARFYNLLDASSGKSPLTLTCHCLGEHCHRDLARDFLEQLREQRKAEPASPPPPLKTMPPARDWTHRRQSGVEMAMLIEHPNRTAIAHP